MKDLTQEQIDHIVFLWGPVDFTFKVYLKWDYHTSQGKNERPLDEIKGAHESTTDTLETLLGHVAGTWTATDLISLTNVGKDLCKWNLRYPLEMNFGAFSEWLLIARHARGKASAREIRQEEWEELRAYYLKIKDLQMQSGEIQSVDWDYLKKYYEENKK